ncbi:decapping and exoribonuclease protein-like [Epargyreus clarus]|uniref:decapping and exoribonuclease protein-like n=1 Tax=Epargyreus clarus TaxID=520877 RepID=UPI003C2AF275
MHPELPAYPSIYSKPFPDFGKPKIIGFIGLENLKFARIVKDANVRLNLNRNMNEVIRKPPDLDVKLTELLRFLLENEIRLKYVGADTLDAADFFCYRGLMTCLACTPYEKREPWKIVAVLHKGSIYLCARETEEQKQRKQRATEEEKKFASWGFKFEQYMLSDGPKSQPNPNVPVDETKEFSLIFKTNLNEHTILYGAEMDGIRCDTPINPPPSSEAGVDEIVKYLSTKEFIELKTNRHIEFSNQERSFRQFKTKKWWCQSFLVGITKILCGFRDHFGIVEELKVYEVSDLPKISKNFWDPNICFNFLDAFLKFVKTCLGREIEYHHGKQAINKLSTLPLIALQFEWQPGSTVQVSRDYRHEDDPILPNWFVNAFGKKVQ